jgi:hypothetical protein
MPIIADKPLSRSAAAPALHVYVRPSVQPVPRPRPVEADTW